MPSNRVFRNFDSGRCMMAIMHGRKQMWLRTAFCDLGPVTDPCLLQRIQDGINA